MSPLAARLSFVRAFHSPFVALSASSRLTTPSHTTTAPVYEKQDDSSPEPHLSSSGTRTYVVSEPDPSNTPYEVPSGAYPTSESYVNVTPTTSSSLYPSNARTVGESAAVRSTEVSGESSRKGGSHSRVGPVDAPSAKRGKF